MGRRAAEPLEKKDIILFQGDWDRLAAILAPRKVKVTVFIRALVRKKLLEIESKVNMIAKPGQEINPDDLDLRELSATAEPADGGESGEPG